MNNCDRYHEKIIEFNELSADQQNEVRQHLTQCDGCRQYYEQIRSIQKTLLTSQQGNHIDDDLLTRYAIQIADPKSSDYDGRRLSSKQRHTIRTHTQQCPLCQNKLEHLQAEYLDIEQYLENAAVPNVTIGKVGIIEQINNRMTELYKSASIFFKNFLDIKSPRFYTAAAVVVTVVLVAIWVGPLFRSHGDPYSQLALIESQEIRFLTRSSQSQALNQGLSAFNAGNWDQAIDRLSQFIEQTEDDFSSAYAHEIIGIAYLLQAQSHTKKQDQIETGLHHLETAFTLSDNIRIREDALWYIGKGNLMKRDIAKASQAFQDIISMNGLRSASAKGMLTEIQKLQAPE